MTSTGVFTPSITTIVCQSVIAVALMLAPDLAMLNPYTMEDIEMLQCDGITASSSMGRHLLHKSHGNNSNNYNACSAYSIDDTYTANVCVKDRFDLETYLDCAEYEVTDKDSTEIVHYLGPYCAD